MARVGRNPGQPDQIGTKKPDITELHRLVIEIIPVR
jgi:hypothetical protein